MLTKHKWTGCLVAAAAAATLWGLTVEPLAHAQDAPPPAPAAAEPAPAPAPAAEAAPAPAPAEPAPAEPAPAADEGPSVELFTTNNLWMMIAAALVFIMHLGFATVESGLTQSKNTVNILGLTQSKNTVNILGL
ncbi:MAG: hypothetical protein LDL31_10490, partial [Prosthecobacter sp.]|nr:hypothetical protein [Prosthecobacter sp.]